MKLVGGGAAANTRLKPLQDNDFVMAVVSFFPPAFSWGEPVLTSLRKKVNRFPHAVM